MHIKHIHCMIEGLAEYGKCMIEAGVGNGNVNLCEASQIVDMIKDLADAEYHSLISKEMKEYKEEEEAEEKYMMRRLKEERKDELKRMKEEYGEDEGEKRFYDNYRYASGRFAPKGRGSYQPENSGRRRGYDEPFIPDMGIRRHWRDMDRMDGRMYYPDAVIHSTGTSTATGSGQPYVNPNEMNRYYTPSANSSSSGGSGSYAGNNSARMGYSDGYSRDAREGRSGMSRRTYMEKKELHPGNSMDDSKEKMESLADYLSDFGSDMGEMISDMGNKEKEMSVSKLMEVANMIKRTMQK